MAGLGGLVFTLRSIGFAFDRFILDPLQNIGDRFIVANENARRFQNAIGGVTGGARARALDQALISASRDLPFSVEEIRESARTYASLPSLADRLNDPDAARQVVNLAKTTQKLAVLDPARGTSGALTAVRELYESGGGESFLSLRRRFGISAQMISKAAGASVDDIKADPDLAARGLRKIIDSLLPDSVLEGSTDLFTVKMQKIRDGIDRAYVKIGKEGLFQSLVDRVDSGVKALFEAVDSDNFARQARRISDAADQALGRVSAAGQKFLRGLIGAADDAPLLDVVGEAAAKGFERLSGLLI
ncbi:MAG TPA: hypothetical protein VGB55_06580, partial [Tepidisphaeraceae bacterium]